MPKKRRRILHNPIPRLYLLNMGGSHDALRGDGVPLTNAQAGLITPTTRAFAAVE